MSYTFAKHETFHIRTGWLRKGLNAIEKEPHIFLEDEAMEILGIGKNMVSSLRYWLQATGLTKETYNSKGQKIQEKTNLAKKLIKYDTYFEDPATFWILHYELIKNGENSATTWYWFFNHFNYNKFDQELFIDNLIKFIKRNGEDVPAESSLKKDYNVFTRMYQFDSLDNRSPENSLESPFADLKLLFKDDNSQGYKVNRPNLNNLPADILFYCILDSINEKDNSLKNNFSINIEDIINGKDTIGKIFNLNPSIFYKYLNDLEEKKYIKVEKQAGLNSITLLEKNKDNVINKYYANN